MEINLHEKTLCSNIYLTLDYDGFYNAKMNGYIFFKNLAEF